MLLQLNVIVCEVVAVVLDVLVFLDRPRLLKMVFKLLGVLLEDSLVVELLLQDFVHPLIDRLVRVVLRQLGLLRILPILGCRVSIRNALLIFRRFLDVLELLQLFNVVDGELLVLLRGFHQHHEIFGPDHARWLLPELLQDLLLHDEVLVEYNVDALLQILPFKWVVHPCLPRCRIRREHHSRLRLLPTERHLPLRLQLLLAAVLLQGEV